MSEVFDVYRTRILSANTEEVKDLKNQIKRSRESGELTENEADNLKDIANRQLESKDGDAYGNLKE